MATIITPVNHWACPNCSIEDVTYEAQPHTRFHTCPGLRGLSAPMVPAGTKAKVELHEREDYIAGDVVTLDPERGRPVMNITTTRDTGQDVVVFAPAASGQAKEL